MVKTSDMERWFNVQREVRDWVIACFGYGVLNNGRERTHRFLEEALELAQSGSLSRTDAHGLVDYVYDRPVGEMHQEVGGVVNTLVSLCECYGLDVVQCSLREMDRVWLKQAEIRDKQRTKPRFGAQPLEIRPGEGAYLAGEGVKEDDDGREP